VLGLSEIHVLERFKPELLHIWNAGGQTLSPNLHHVHEVWLYGYDIQESRRCDQWRWLLKIYLHRLDYIRIGVFNKIEITADLL